MAAVAANAQHAPHKPWFLAGVTAPSALQSIEDGMLLTTLAALVPFVVVIIFVDVLLAKVEVTASGFDMLLNNSFLNSILV